MTYLNADHSSHARSTGFSGLSARLFAAWQRHRAERALEGLSYDTLKDIGFPSVDNTQNEQMTR